MRHPREHRSQHPPVLQWALPLYSAGLSSPFGAERGNMAIASQANRPEWMTTKQYQDAYGTVYNAILRHLKDAKKSGETIDVDKLLLLLREEEPASQREAIDLAYDSLRYYLRKMGFQHGRLCRRMTTNRNKEYIIGWLLVYCDYRAKWATDPTEEMLNEVQFYVDETFMYKNDWGYFGWFCPGDQMMWGKISGLGQRCLGALFCRYNMYRLNVKF